MLSHRTVAGPTLTSLYRNIKCKGQTVKEAKAPEMYHFCPRELHNCGVVDPVKCYLCGCRRSKNVGDTWAAPPWDGT